MSVVTVKLVKNDSFMFYMNEDIKTLARTILAKGGYEILDPMVVDFEGEEAAEEMFDLSNNPSRELECLRVYGRHRPISVGDIVNVDGTDFLCSSIRWNLL